MNTRQKSFFLWRYDDERYCFRLRHIHCSRGWRESGPIVDKSLVSIRSRSRWWNPNQFQIIDYAIPPGSPLLESAFCENRKLLAIFFGNKLLFYVCWEIKARSVVKTGPISMVFPQLQQTLHLCWRKPPPLVSAISVNRGVAGLVKFNHFSSQLLPCHYKNSILV